MSIGASFLWPDAFPSFDQLQIRKESLWSGNIFSRSLFLISGRYGLFSSGTVYIQTYHPYHRIIWNIIVHFCIHIYSGMFSHSLVHIECSTYLRRASVIRCRLPRPSIVFLDNLEWLDRMTSPIVFNNGSSIPPWLKDNLSTILHLTTRTNLPTRYLTRQFIYLFKQLVSRHNVNRTKIHTEESQARRRQSARER